jgi:signal transduction histidine kinase
MRLLSPHSKGTWILISVLLLLLIGVNTYMSRTTITELNSLHRDISQTTKIVSVLEQSHLRLLKAESGQRGFLLTQDESYLKHFTDAVADVRRLIDELQTLPLTLPNQVENAATLRQLLEAKLEELELTVAQAQNDKFMQAIRVVETDEGRILYEKTHDMFKLIKTSSQAIGRAQVAQLKRASDESGYNVLVFFMTSLVLVIGLFILAKLNVNNQRARELEMEAQNENLQMAVDERTKELSLFSDELSRSNRELEDFAFVASHDLQEPLRKIMAFGDRLETQADNLTEKQRDFLQRMRSAAGRMSILISDLLEFSRISTRGKAFQNVSLDVLVQDCLDDLSVLIEETNVRIVVDKLPTLIADSTQMHQLFFNLISNAVKFSQKEDTPTVTISSQSVEQPAAIDLEGLNDWVLISVKDNGIGFDQEYAEKIFAPFQRLHSRDSFKGTGIGLAICRRIVERHNGLINAVSEVGQGATFTVTIPTNNYLISLKQ